MGVNLIICLGLGQTVFLLRQTEPTGSTRDTHREKVPGTGSKSSIEDFKSEFNRFTLGGLTKAS